MKFRKNEEAVSPVIGVILMVAITVILAAVIAAFVFGMGTPTAAPQASIVISSSSASGNYTNLTHRGGEVIDLAKTKAIVEQGTNRLTISTLSANATGTNLFQVGDSVGITTYGSSIVLLNGVNQTIGSVTGQFDLASGKVTLTLIDTDSSKEMTKITATVT